ncbi:hypothetical protein OG216_46930 (plasmid) [Streptomycetaceae bacterium NBC_01309]
MTLEDLGHPEIAGLLDEVTASVSERTRHMLECIAFRLEGECRAEQGGKSRWMFIRRAPAGSGKRWVAAHLPVTHRGTAEEGDQHRATKERIAKAAAAEGLDVETEARSCDGSSVHDALVVGPGGIRIGWEVQYSPISAATVRKRSSKAVANGTTPSWVTHNAASEVIHRAPWARIDDMSWRDIADGRELLVRSGMQHLQIWPCTPSSDRECPDGRGPCRRWHHGWFPPAQCIPEKRHTRLDDLVVSTAYGEHVPLFIPRPRRSGYHLWVAPKELELWRGLQDENPPGPGQDDAGEDNDAVYTDHADGDLEPECRWGEVGFVRNTPRPVRDPAHSARPSNRLAPSVADDPSVVRFDERQRKAVAVLLDCPPWEVGPCAGCSNPVHRYGRNTGMYCAPCRTDRPAHQGMPSV